MNKKDLTIVSALRKDARMSLTNMSKKTRIPVSTLFDRIKDNDYILRHTSLVDFYKLGFATRANILLKVDRSDKQALQDYLKKDWNINSVFRVNNGYDFMVEGIFKEIKDMEAFLDKLSTKFKIVDVKSYFIIEDLRRESFMTDEETIEII